jgi:adenylyl cyclase-associated protein
MSLESVIGTLVKRLESVTSRLEAIEKQVGSGGGSAAPSAPSAASSGGSSASVNEFEDLINGAFKAYVAAANKLGGDLTAQAQLVEKAVQELHDVVVAASKAKKPSDAELNNLTANLKTLSGQIVEHKDKLRTSKQFNHLSAVAEGINALLWVLVSPTPGPFVAEARDSSTFYVNRVLKDHKGDADNTNVVNNWVAFLKEMEAYIKRHHTTGLSWNAKGAALSEVAKTSAPVAAAPQPSSGGAPPPPPPGPPPPPLVVEDSGSSDATPAMGGVFAAINSGNLTGGLKKVTKEMKSKYNPDKSSVVPESVGKKTTTPTAAAKKTAPKKPPVCALEGQKWKVEFQENNQALSITPNHFKEVVYVYRCENSVLQIDGKINSIMVDSCKKVAIVFDNAVASVEIVNSSGMQVQCKGEVPSVAVDRTSGCQIYLTETGAPKTDIYTSESSEINICITKPDADLVEFAVPTQYKSNYINGQLVTEVVGLVLSGHGEFNEISIGLGDANVNFG